MWWRRAPYRRRPWLSSARRGSSSRGLRRAPVSTVATGSPIKLAAGFEELTALFRHAYDRGIRFFDLADLDGSHPVFPRTRLRNSAGRDQDSHEDLVAVRRAQDCAAMRSPARARLAGRRSSGSATRSTPTISTSCCCTVACRRRGITTWRCTATS